MNEQNQSDEISLKELLKRKEWFDCFSKWKIIVLAGLIGAALDWLFFTKTTLPLVCLLH
jgi:hypothetical protein